MSALMTVTELQSMAGVAASPFTSTQLAILIQALSDNVTNFVKRNLAQQQYTEYYSGDNSVVLQLRQFPVLSVSRVSVDYNGNFGQSPNAFPTTGDLVQGVDYSIMAGVGGIGSSGILRRIGQVWWQGRAYVPGKVAPQPAAPNGSILVTYIAGYSPIPYAIKLAVCQAVIDAANRIQSGGPLASAAYQGAAASWFSPELMMKVFGSVQQTLSSYRLPPV